MNSETIALFHLLETILSRVERAQALGVTDAWKTGADLTQSIGDALALAASGWDSEANTKTRRVAVDYYNRKLDELAGVNS